MPPTGDTTRQLYGDIQTLRRLITSVPYTSGAQKLARRCHHQPLYHGTFTSNDAVETAVLTSFFGHDI